MKHRVITIIRQFGSGGRTIGRQAAAQLNIPCYDQELMKRGLTPSYIAEKGEYAAHRGWLANAFTDRDANVLSTHEHLWQIQRKVILDLPEQSPCVIVGRCADAILKDTADCLTVFIHASLERCAALIAGLF